MLNGEVDDFAGASVMGGKELTPLGKVVEEVCTTVGDCEGADDNSCVGKLVGK
jgi:hypothetical protein